MREFLLASAVAASVMFCASAAASDARLIALNASGGQAFCQTFSFNIYFERDGARLSEPAERMLDYVRDRTRGCAVKSVAVKVPASQQGNAMADQRGAVILSALKARGVNAAHPAISRTSMADGPAPPHALIKVDASAPSTNRAAPRTS